MFRNTPQPLDIAKAVYSVALWAVFFWSRWRRPTPAKSP